MATITRKTGCVCVCVFFFFWALVGFEEAVKPHVLCRWSRCVAGFGSPERPTSRPFRDSRSRISFSAFSKNKVAIFSEKETKRFLEPYINYPK